MHTITYGNGREIAHHECMAIGLETRAYFAHTYVSWGRGLNDNTNGLNRQYFPNKRDPTAVTNNEIEQAMNKLNHRPIMSLSFLTPPENSFKIRNQLTVLL